MFQAVFAFCNSDVGESDVTNWHLIFSHNKYEVLQFEVNGTVLFINDLDVCLLRGSALTIDGDNEGFCVNLGGGDVILANLHRYKQLAGR